MRAFPSRTRGWGPVSGELPGSDRSVLPWRAMRHTYTDRARPCLPASLATPCRLLLALEPRRDFIVDRLELDVALFDHIGDLALGRLLVAHEPARDGRLVLCVDQCDGPELRILLEFDRQELILERSLALPVILAVYRLRLPLRAGRVTSAVLGGDRQRSCNGTTSHQPQHEPPHPHHAPRSFWRHASHVTLSLTCGSVPKAS